MYIDTMVNMYYEHCNIHNSLSCTNNKLNKYIYFLLLFLIFVGKFYYTFKWKSNCEIKTQVY